jgi:hypothetical protein
MPSELAPPTGNHRLIWNILLSRNILPLVAVGDEMSILTTLAREPLTLEEAANRFALTAEWAEIVFGTLSLLELTRVQDNRIHITNTAAQFFWSPTARITAAARFRTLSAATLIPKAQARHAQPRDGLGALRRTRLEAW